MSAFIVSGGSLLELRCPSSLVRSTEQQVSFTRTLAGKRKGYVRKGGRRAWSVDVSTARPSEVSTLEVVARNLGPVGWFPPEAVVGNLLSPQASGFDAAPANGMDSGLVALPDGTVARAATHVGTGLVYVGGTDAPLSWEMVPVVAGEPITVSVWARNGVRITGFWRDAAGDALSTPDSGVRTGTGWGLHTATFTPPAAAAFYVMALSVGTQYARPSVAWGSRARDEMGTGCPSAIIHSPSHSPVALWEGANYTDSSYTVTEVG